MSEEIFNKVPVVGDKYKFSDWQRYAVHDDPKEIRGFFGSYRWLSNFYLCKVLFEGILYPSSENAFQAAKCDSSVRAEFQLCTPAVSKNLWKSKKPLYTSEQWNQVKYDVMSVILFNKFYANKDLRQKLLDTGTKFLEETNHWKDVDWGFDIRLGGKNNLGKILMGVRKYWAEFKAT